MRNTVFFLSCLLASLWISIAFADNGVERGSIEYSQEVQIPSSLRVYLEKLMFTRCDLKGAAKIRTNFALLHSDAFDNGVSTKRYMIEFQVSYKNASTTNSIYVDVLMTESEFNESSFELSEFHSSICNPH